MQTKLFPTSVQVHNNITGQFGVLDNKYYIANIDDIDNIDKIFEGRAGGIAYLRAVCGGAYGVSCPHTYF